MQNINNPKPPTMKNLIKQIIESNQFQGRDLYYLAAHHENNLGDESSTITLIYEEIFNYRAREENGAIDEAYRKLEFELLRIDPPFYRGNKLIHENGLCRIWVSDANDILTIQLTDHSIHFTLHYSGQY